MSDALIEAIKGLNAEKQIITNALCRYYSSPLTSRLRELDAEIYKLLSRTNPIS